MAETAEEGATKAGIVWKRALSLFVVCMVAVGVLAVGLILGVIPVQFGISKNPFTINLDKLRGTDITAYAGNDIAVDKGETAVIIAGIEGGDGENLCLTTELDLPLVGDLAIKITSGGSEPIPLSKLVAEGTEMGIGEVVVNDIELGGEASSFTQSDLIRGPKGTWAIQMQNADVDKITLAGEKIKVASLQLRGLGLGVKLGDFRLGDHRCPA